MLFGGPERPPRHRHFGLLWMDRWLRRGPGPRRCFSAAMGPPSPAGGLRSKGLHSSTRLEVEALGLGLELAERHCGARRDVHELRLASDSQAAILAISTGHATSEAVCRARIRVHRVLEVGHKVSFMWVPGHTVLCLWE